MPEALDVRRAKWAAFVQRALNVERVSTRSWTPAQVAAATAEAAENREHAVSKSTIYRWARGEWNQAPEPEKVVAFCDVLGIPPTAAFAVLWPGKHDRPAEPEPAPMDPDALTVLRRLNDPNVSEAERYHIRETLRGLAARTGRRPA